MVDQALDRYLKMLDACAATKDIFSQTKDDVKEFLSSLRRKMMRIEISRCLSVTKMSIQGLIDILRCQRTSVFLTQEKDVDRHLKMSIRN